MHQTRRWPVHLSTALAAFGLKAFYSRAGVDDLTWILAPTAAVVGWLRGQPLLHDSNLGWRAADGSFVIAPACAGVNFAILVFTIGVLGFVHRFRTPRRRWAWLLAVAAFAYFFTITVNALRIILAIELYGSNIYGSWVTPERVHRMAGTVIYLAALWLACSVLDRVSGPRLSVSSASSLATVAVPAAYVAMTVVLPLANGAWRRFGAIYVEHAITVALIAAGWFGVRWLATALGRRKYECGGEPPHSKGPHWILPLLSPLRWATSGTVSPGSATRDERDG